MRDQRWRRVLPMLSVLVGAGVLVGLVWSLVAGNLAIGRVTNVRAATTRDGARAAVIRVELAPLPARIIVIPKPLFPTEVNHRDDLHGHPGNRGHLGQAAFVSRGRVVRRRRRL
jgi:hypothetical protein